MKSTETGHDANDSHAGAVAERAAERWLRQRGFNLIMRNYRCRLGEIDLIMRDKDELVFVEVRLRSNGIYGSAEESVTVAKQRRLWRAAQHFLATHPRWARHACRFDVMASGRVACDEQDWRWSRAAFEVAG